MAGDTKVESGLHPVHPGFPTLLSYLQHLRDRASELKAVHITVSLPTLDSVILDLMELEEVRK